MTAAFNRHVLRLYEESLDHHPDTRAAWLATACEDDPQALDAVRALCDGGRAAMVLPTEPPGPRVRAQHGPAPARVGQYRIVDEIGRGGMGVVYRGERDDGLFEHKVAIKLIRRTIFSDRALAQFANERRILARLRHPHIAQMLDGGTTDDGSSYIVMELIAGTPIVEHCTRHGIALAGRLALFRQMGVAVEHAHRSLIVHADIKPSNVVVEDSFGVKLLDFGIARLIDEGDGPGHAAYTPGFASPARIEGQSATPADDIFSAGVLLDVLVRDVPGDDDLAAVIAKARHADPERRYGRIGELIADIDCWRARKPVAAAPPTRARRLHLFWLRHRWLIAAAALLAAVVLVALAETTTLWLRAERDRVAAEQRYDEARALSRYLIDDVTAELAPLPRSSPLREQIAMRAERGLEQLGGAAGTRRQMEIDDALASVEVGEILATDGREGLAPDATLAALRRAEAGLPRLIAKHPDRPDLLLLLARAYIVHAGFAGHVLNDPGAAGRLLGRADAALDRLKAVPTFTTDIRDLRWDIANVRAAVRSDHGDDEAANIPLLEGALRRAATPPSPSTAMDALRLNRSLNLLGDAYFYQGRKPTALAMYRRALQALSDPRLSMDFRVVERTAFEDYQIASTLADCGRNHEALATMRRGADTATRLRSFDDTPLARHTYNIAQSELGAELSLLGRYDAAIAHARISLAGAMELARAEPSSYAAQRAVPVDLRPLAEIYLRAGRHAEACAAIGQARADWAALGRRWRLGAFDGLGEERLLARLGAGCH